jgi:hypothetical protein
MEESNNQGGENKPDKPQEGKQDAQEGTQTLPQNPAQASLPANGVPNPIVPVLPIEAICVKVHFTRNRTLLRCSRSKRSFSPYDLLGAGVHLLSSSLWLIPRQRNRS